MRVLLIARDGAGLQVVLGRQVQDSVRWLTRGRVLRVGPQGGEGDRERWYLEAVGRFARDLEVLAPERTQLAGRVGDPDETMLVLLARALLTVVEAGTRSYSAGELRRLPMAEIIAELFIREVAWWERTARSPIWAVSAFGTETLQRAILALALRGADDEDAAVRVLRRVPDLSDASEGALRSTARWVSHLYPASGFGVRIEPDLLGDWFIVDYLTRGPDLAGNLLGDLDAAERHHAVLLLTQAALTFPAVLPVLAGLWRSGNDDDAILAVRIAVNHHNALIDGQLALFLAGRELTEPELAALEAQLPDLGLPRSHIAVGKQQVTCYRALAANNSAHQPNLASTLANLGNHLSELGEHRQAHAAAAEALDIWRKLVADNPAHQPDLASTLIGFGRFLSELGEHRQAHAAEVEAVDIWRKLVANNPAHQPLLASALHNLGRCLSDRGEHREAHAAKVEAVDIWRKLVANNPAHQPNLASALNNLGGSLSELGEHRQAHAAAVEAVEVARKLVADNPAHQPRLAILLKNLAVHSCVLNDHDIEFTLLLEAMDLLRAAAERDKQLWQSAYVQAVYHLKSTYARHGRNEDAIRLIMPPPDHS